MFTFASLLLVNSAICVFCRFFCRRNILFLIFDSLVNRLNNFVVDVRLKFLYENKHVSEYIHARIDLFWVDRNFALC